MKKIFNKEFKIGISIIVALVILFFGIDYLKGKNIFSPANYYYATYENVNGLEISAPVTINGYKVGQVREINFDYQNPGKVKVLLALNKNLHLPEDSQAQLASTLLSGAYVNIKLGNSKKMLAVGGDVATAEGNDLMESVNDNLMPTVNEILPKIDSLISNLNAVAGDPALLASIRRLDGITGNIYNITDGLQTTINRDVPRVIGKVGSITHGLDTVADNLVVLSAQLRALPLATTVDNVNAITNNLIDFSTRLNNTNSTLGQLTGDSELYRRLNSVAEQVDSLVVDIKKNPKRYINIKLL